MHWSSRPFVRIIIFFAAGILLAYHVPVFRQIDLKILIACILFLLAIATLLYVYLKSWTYKWLNGLTLGIAITLSGIFFTSKFFNKADIHFPTEGRLFIGNIVKQPSVTDQSVKTIIRISDLADSAVLLDQPVTVMAFFAKDSSSQLLTFGDKLLFTSRITKPAGPKNPGEFNYATFLSRTGINGIVYIRNADWTKLGNEPGSPLFSLANNARLSLLQALRENGLDNNEFAVAAAIILGYDDMMDDELSKDYVLAGAMHILCVSGLHVGIVYLVLNFILGFLHRSKWQIMLKTVLLLLFVWSYALLTGLAPSVWRASLMISLFIVSSALQRSRDPYNTLSAAAVIMLIIDPMLLFNLGFQLSYTAVLGILIFYRPIYTLFIIQNPLLDKVWSIVVVSSAAQLGTFPLVAHYFHFLPTYFWLTNIFIFPVSFGIIATGMLFIMTAWIPILSNGVGLLLSGLVYVMNWVVGWVEYLPINGMDGLYYPWIKVFLVYALIIFSYRFLLGRKVRFLLPVKVTILLLLIIHTYRSYELSGQHRIIVYAINKHSVLDLIDGKQHHLMMDSLMHADTKKQDYHLKNGQITMGIYSTKTDDHQLNYYDDQEFCAFGNYRFVRINGSENIFPGSMRMNLDAVFISGKRKVDLQKLLICFNTDLVILDGSVPFWKRMHIKESGEKLGIVIYDVLDQGAYIKDL